MDKKFGIGQPVPRVEDPRFITGRGRYVDDFDLPQQAHAVLVMSPHPGTVKAALRILLERPRDPLSAEFLEWQKNLLRHLGHETAGDETQKSNGKATT